MYCMSSISCTSTVSSEQTVSSCNLRENTMDKDSQTLPWHKFVQSNMTCRDIILPVSQEKGGKEEGVEEREKRTAL
jgi:alkylated DNA nucleotide flippase Atl1